MLKASPGVSLPSESQKGNVRSRYLMVTGDESSVHDVEGVRVGLSTRRIGGVELSIDDIEVGKSYCVALK
jgi:hypothetical protein